MESILKEEKDVWSGTPSQVVNMWSFIFCPLTGGIYAPIALWKWLVVKNTKYELTSQRFKTRSGVLNKKTDELELYRIQDYKMEQPFFLRLFSLSNIVLQTSDKSHPRVVLSAIPNGEELREKIRFHVEESKLEKRVRVIDVD